MLARSDFYCHLYLFSGELTSLDLVHNNKILCISSFDQGFIDNKWNYSDMHEAECGSNFRGLCARMDPIKNYLDIYEKLT